MAKKKVVLPQKRIKELKGFEDVIDLIDSEGKQYIGAKKDKGILEDYEIFDFLEKEYQRLGKLDELFSKKISILQKYPQLPKLVHKQKYAKDEAKSELTFLIMDENGPFIANLTHWFNTAFPVDEETNSLE